MRRDPALLAAAQLSRRRLFVGLGAGAAGAIALGATGGAAYADHQNASGQAPANRFGRMFPDLNPFLVADQLQAGRNAMIEIGRTGGMMDARDPLSAGPDQLILDPALSANNPNNTSHTAGTTFFGQFLDHDMTLDVSSPLGQPFTPQQSPNGRTPALDLDSVYGAGPVGQPQLYQSDGIHLRIESGGRFEDVPRQGNGTAIIADSRNDENAIISGMQAAFILFHNRVVDGLLGSGFNGNVFAEARRLVTWHYQWIIVNEFLPQIIGQQMVNTIRSQGRRYYHPTGPAFIPVEFQIAYRMGHSMIRPSYALNLFGNPGDTPFFGFIFDPAGQNQADPVDLRGGRRAPRRFVSWDVFFQFNTGNTRPNKLIDLALSTPLFNLPLGTLPDGAPPVSLASRNLLRHITWNMPGGQRIAQVMGNQMLVVQEVAGFGLPLENQTPLWFYVLAEAERLAGGTRLGPTGGRLVGEVFLGLLQLDPTSYLAAQPNWTPTLGATPGQFRMADLLTVARVDPASRAAAA